MSTDPDNAILIFLFGNMALYFALLAPWGQWWNRRKLYWRDFRRSLMAGAFLLLLAGSVRADSIWTYAGQSTNLYSQDPSAPPAGNPCACALTGTVDLADAWTPITWNFNAGGMIFTDQNSTLDAYLGPDDPRPTFSWSFFFLRADGQSLISKFSGSITDALDAGGNLSVGSNPGTWTDPPVSTPEPGAALLIAIALAFLALLQYHPHRRRIA